MPPGILDYSAYFIRLSDKIKRNLKKVIHRIRSRIGGVKTPFWFHPLLAIGKMVGAVRFELTTSCTRNKRATRLRYAPTQNNQSASPGQKCNGDFSNQAGGKPL